MTFEQSPGAGSPGDRDAGDRQTNRRILSLLIVLAVIGAPAIVLRVLCVGKACDEAGSVASTVPFCSLPDELRTRIGSGFREGRSPDVLAVTKNATVVGGTGIARGPKTPWPSASSTDAAVPIAFLGTGLPAAVDVPPGTGLDDIAPTLASLLAYERPHPEVRSGRALTGFAASSRLPRLLLVVVWKGVGTKDLRANESQWPNLAQIAESGSATMEGEAGSMPLDPAAVLTTIGTGGLPFQHGITSRAVLNDEGDLVRAWSRAAPVSVIATLADDWDDARDQQPIIGLVGTDPTDQGAIGGNWYVNGDSDRMNIVSPPEVLRSALDELREGYGDDEVADIAVVVDEGPIGRMDSNLAMLAGAAQQRSKDAFAMVVTATGSLEPPKDNVVAASEVKEEVEQAISAADPVIDAAAPGGLYLDQATLAKEKIADDEIIAALEEVSPGQGGRLMDQVFPAIAVSFARYC